MVESWLALAALIVHLLFIAWVMLGALAVWRRPGLAALHLPAVAWAVWIEWSGGICPLTPLEQQFLIASGAAGYQGGFVEHYLLALLYPEALTRGMQFVIGAVVLVLNVGLYAVVWRGWRRRGADQSPD